MIELAGLAVALAVIILAAGVALGRAIERRAPLGPLFDDEGRLYDEGPPIPREDVRETLREAESIASEHAGDYAAGMRYAIIVVEEGLFQR
jgi:hypothetical protein